MVLPAGAGTFFEVKLVQLHQMASGGDATEAVGLRTAPAQDSEPFFLDDQEPTIAPTKVVVPSDLHSALSAGLRESERPPRSPLRSPNEVAACSPTSLFPPGCDPCTSAQESSLAIELSRSSDLRGLRAVTLPLRGPRMATRELSELSDEPHIGSGSCKSSRPSRFKRYKMRPDRDPHDSASDAGSEVRSEVGSEVGSVEEAEPDAPPHRESNAVSQLAWLSRQEGLDGRSSSPSTATDPSPGQEIMVWGGRAESRALGRAREASCEQLLRI